MRNALRPQLWVPVVAAIVAGAAMFAVGYAANDGGGTGAPAEADDVRADGMVASVPARAGGPMVAPATGGRGGDGARLASQAFAPGPYGGGCPAPLDGVLSGGKLDLGALQPRLLNSDFTLSSLGVSATTNCYEPDASPRTFRTVNTTWMHAASGMSVGVTETDGADRTANFMWESGGNFWSKGRSYSVWVGGPAVMPVDEGGVAPQQPDFAAMQALAWTVVKQIAPELEERCFDRQAPAGWADLADLGIGDPHPAVPGRFVVQYEQLSRFIAADPSCGNPAFEGGYPVAAANAMWQGDEGEHLNVSAHVMPDGERGKLPGQVGQRMDGGLFWANHGVQFNVNWVPGMLTDEQVRAIARALDPRLDQVCFVTQSEFSTAAAAKLGIGPLAVPDGYQLQHSFGQRAAGTGDCAGQSGFGIQWALAGDGVGFIQAAAWGGLSTMGGFEARYLPNVEGQTLYWKNAKGYEFLVVGMADLKGDRRALLAIARSLDPSFDESKLLDPPGETMGPPYPLSAPLKK